MVVSHRSQVDLHTGLPSSPLDVSLLPYPLLLYLSARLPRVFGLNFAAAAAGTILLC